MGDDSLGLDVAQRAALEPEVGLVLLGEDGALRLDLGRSRSLASPSPTSSRTQRPVAWRSSRDLRKRRAPSARPRSPPFLISSWEARLR